MTNGLATELDIFEGGRLKATLNLRKEQQQEAAITYQRVVLSAWHEIDNALTAYSAEQQRGDQLEASVADNRKQSSTSAFTGLIGTSLAAVCSTRVSRVAAESFTTASSRATRSEAGNGEGAGREGVARSFSPPGARERPVTAARRRS